MADIDLSVETTISVYPGCVARRAEYVESALYLTDDLITPEFSTAVKTEVGVSEVASATNSGLYVETSVGVSDVEAFIKTIDKGVTTPVNVSTPIVRRIYFSREVTTEVGVEIDGRRVHPLSVTTVVNLLSEDTVDPTTPVTTRVGVLSVVGLTRYIYRSIVTALTARSGNLLRAPEYPCLDTPIGSRDTVRLTYPYVSPTTTIDMRPPNFGNNQALDTGALNQSNMDQIPEQIRPSSWNDITILSYSFQALSTDLIEDLIDFMTVSRGKEIGYLDHENRQWRGFIIDPEIVFSSDFSPCTNTIAFKIRGRLA